MLVERKIFVLDLHKNIWYVCKNICHVDNGQLRSELMGTGGGYWPGWVARQVVGPDEDGHPGVGNALADRDATRGGHTDQWQSDPDH